ncbi:hypothetical protein AcetOrient_orf02050 [Acetobacter orientalis]|uniref:Uncharacterized protein n=1 Tax=Acetobacter orientalis TaxID=146474 RepID=A0A2Z5ZGA1_9PROT|nr:hypothetical protein AcetOrient_orf02050 [Acetobacter orientalis]
MSRRWPTPLTPGLCIKRTRGLTNHDPTLAWLFKTRLWPRFFMA